MPRLMGSTPAIDTAPASRARRQISAAPGSSWHSLSEICGQHGYLDTHPEVAAVWLARGAGVPKRHIREESLTEVSSFVATLAGVQPPSQAQPWRP